MRAVILCQLFLCIFALVEAKEDPLDHATVSCYAVHMPSGKVLIDENSDKSLVPASCMKLVTTATALHLLHPDSNFTTELAYDGFIDEKGTLQGNLYIIGGGDPCLGSFRFVSLENQIALWSLAAIDAGIKAIKGKVFGDASKWEEAMAVPSWQWEDLGNYYGAGASALSFHENAYFLWLKSGKQLGEPVSVVRMEPEIPFLAFKNRSKTGDKGSGDNIIIYGSEFSLSQHIRGTIPLGEEAFLVKGAIPSPAFLAAELLKKDLQSRQIPVLEDYVEENTSKTVIHKTHSPDLSKIVFETNQHSINLYAEHLLKQMGEGSSEKGLKAVTDFWHAQKINLSGFYMADGSGLSRKNLLTTKQLVSILLFMKKGPYFSFFFDSLPKSGDVQAKSGSMSLIKAYAGYRGDIAFAIFINQCPDGQLARKKIEEFVDSLQNSLLQ